MHYLFHKTPLLVAGNSRNDGEKITAQQHCYTIQPHILQLIFPKNDEVAKHFSRSHRKKHNFQSNSQLLKNQLDKLVTQTFIIWPFSFSIKNLRITKKLFRTGFSMVSSLNIDFVIDTYQ